MSTDIYESHREDRYRHIFKATAGGSPLLNDIWRGAFGTDYPDDVSPFGFVTRRDLADIAAALPVSTGSTLLDVGCGTGGPGMWVARKLRSRLTGIDVVAEAVAAARTAAHMFGLEYAPAFSCASFTATDLPDACMDAVMSVDAFWMVLDKQTALREMKRVMRPGARFVMTTWVPTYFDIAALVHATGLAVVSVEETHDWKSRQLGVYRRILDNSERLVTALGRDAAETLVSEARGAPEHLDETRRVRIVIDKPA